MLKPSFVPDIVCELLCKPPISYSRYRSDRSDRKLQSVVSRCWRVAHVYDAQPTFRPPIFQDLYPFPSSPLLSRFVRSSSGRLDDRYVAVRKCHKVLHKVYRRNRVATPVTVKASTNDFPLRQNSHVVIARHAERSIRRLVRRLLCCSNSTPYSLMTRSPT